MAHEGPTPVLSQDDTHPATSSPSTTSKTPRTLSFISNVQTAVAQIEDKLASSPSAYPPPPHRHEIPQTPPGPEDPVIDRVQFLESSLSISPLKAPKISSIAESAFGGVINPDPSLTSTGVIVSTTPPTNVTTTRYADDNTIPDATDNTTAHPPPSIAPIVQQFEMPTTPVYSREHESEIVGAPIAPIVEQFEAPDAIADNKDHRDVVDFASGSIAPIVGQFESPKTPEAEKGTPEHADLKQETQSAPVSQNLDPMGEHATHAQHADVVNRTHSVPSHDKPAQEMRTSMDENEIISSTGHRLRTKPVFKALEPSANSLEVASERETVQTETETEPLIAPTGEYPDAVELQKHPTSENDLSSLMIASHTELGTAHNDTEATSERIASIGALTVSDRNENGDDREAESSKVRLESILSSSSVAQPQTIRQPPRAADEKSKRSVVDASKVVPATKATVSELADSIDDIGKSIDDRCTTKDAKKESQFEASGMKPADSAFTDDTSETVETKASVSAMKAQDSNKHDDVPADEIMAGDTRTETFETKTANASVNTSGSMPEGYTEKEPTKAMATELISSGHGEIATFDNSTTSKDITNASVHETVPSGDDDSAAVDENAVPDKAMKARANETEKSNDGISVGNDNTASMAVKVSATKTVDSSSENGTLIDDNTITDEMVTVNVAAIMEPVAEGDITSFAQTSNPTRHMDSTGTKTFSVCHPLVSPEEERSVRESAKSSDVLNSSARNSSADVSSRAMESETPDIQLDNSMSITIVVQTSSTPVSTGVTISTDDSARPGNLAASRKPLIVSTDEQNAIEEHATTTANATIPGSSKSIIGEQQDIPSTSDDMRKMKSSEFSKCFQPQQRQETPYQETEHVATQKDIAGEMVIGANILNGSEQRETGLKVRQAEEPVADDLSAEKEASDCTAEEAPMPVPSGKVAQTSHEENPASPEQESLNTMTTRAIHAREKLSKAHLDSAVKGNYDNLFMEGIDSFSSMGELKSHEFRENSVGTKQSTQLQGASRTESTSTSPTGHDTLVKGSGDVKLNSSPEASNKASRLPSGRTHRQSFTRGATTTSPLNRSGISTESCVQKQEKNTPQSAPVSPVRTAKPSPHSFSRLPRVAGLSSIRHSSAAKPRASPTGRTAKRIPRSSTFTSSVPRANSVIGSPMSGTKSGLASSPVTPKSASKRSEIPRVPLRRTLSLSNSRLVDNSSSASRVRYSLTQKFEEMKRTSISHANDASSALPGSGSGSKPPLGGRPRVTVPEPFALFGPELHEMSEKQMSEARKKQAEDAARPRVFKPRPMPKFSKPNASQIVRRDQNNN